MKTENISSCGTVSAQLLATSCCLGPVIFVLSGASVGALGKLAFMEPLSPYFLLASIVLFGFSFWKLYLKKAYCSCPEEAKSKKIAHGILWMGAVAIILSASFQNVLFYLGQILEINPIQEQ